MKKIICKSLIIVSLMMLFACKNDRLIKNDEEVYETQITTEIVETIVNNEIAKEEKLNVTGDFLSHSFKGNLNGGLQWKYEIKNGLMSKYDDMVNFYDIDSKTEIGDLFYFFRAEKEGNDEIIWTLYDTSTGKVFCKITDYINVVADKSENGFNIFTLVKMVVEDDRTVDLEAYKYDMPEVSYHIDGNGC